MDQVCVVSEDFIALAILRLVEIEKSVIEGAGASGLAACLSGKLSPLLSGKKLVCVVWQWYCVHMLCSVAVVLCGSGIVFTCCVVWQWYCVAVVLCSHVV